MLYYLAGDIGGTNSRLQLWELGSPSNSSSSTASTRRPSTSSSSSSNHASHPPVSPPSFHSEHLLSERVYSSQQYASLTFVIDKFLREVSNESGIDLKDLRPSACCLAVAGPVRANKATITNVNWVLDGREMSVSLGIPDLLIINDFVGVGYGILALDHEKDIVVLNDAPRVPEAPKACIGAGTGLGEVYLTAGYSSLDESKAEMMTQHDDDNDDHEIDEDDGDDAGLPRRRMLSPIGGGGGGLDGCGDSTLTSDVEYNVWSSEGGHTDFAPRDRLEFGLLEHIKQSERVPRVSVERVVSGLGLPKIYEYLAHLHPEEVRDSVTARLRTEDAGRVIHEYAAKEGADRCDLCRQAVELFIKCYGAEAGNMALKTLPFGGMYIAGGIAPKLREFLTKNYLFYQHFVQKGRMQPVLEKIPLYIITNEQVGLLGAQVVCRRLIRRRGFMPGRGELTSFAEAVPATPTPTPGRSMHMGYGSTAPAAATTSPDIDVGAMTNIPKSASSEDLTSVSAASKAAPSNEQHYQQQQQPYQYQYQYQHQYQHRQRFQEHPRDRIQLRRKNDDEQQHSANDSYHRKHVAMMYGAIAGATAGVISVATIVGLTYFLSNSRFKRWRNGRQK